MDLLIYPIQLVFLFKIKNNLVSINDFHEKVGFCEVNLTPLSKVLMMASTFLNSPDNLNIPSTSKAFKFEHLVFSKEFDVLL